MRLAPLLIGLSLAATALARADATLPAAPVGDAKLSIPRWAPVRGPRFAKVTIVEWADFQCPYCARVSTTVREIEKLYGNNVRFVFRHEPLAFHQHAREAALASVAAHAQGKFWPMHDLLFANFQKLERADLDGYARTVGLDMQRYQQAMASPATAAPIDADAKRATEAGVTGTPSFFINGRSLVGAQPIEALRTVLDEELVRADAELSRGTPIERLYEELIAHAPPPPAR